MEFKQLRQVLGVLGMLIFTEGIFMLLCTPIALYYGEEYNSMLFSGALTVAIGLIFSVIRSRKTTKRMDKRVAFFTVGLAWATVSALGALPYMFSNVLPSFTDAYFEAMSGFTTTGASVIENVDLTPKVIIFWRALTQWIGGMGIVVLVVAVIPFLGINSMSLYSAEVSGPSKDKLHPRILTSARRLWNTYCIVTLVVFLLLVVGGLSPFESITNTFAAVSTGGFGVRSDSVGSYTPYVQYVIAFAMIISAFNYSLNYYLLKGSFKKVFQNEEFKVFMIIILVSSTIMAGGLILTSNYNVEESIRHGFFQVASIASTTGFVSADYNAWFTPLLFLFLIIMLSGGMAGSTSGGLKTIRVMILFKNCRQVLKNIVHSRAFLPVRVDGKAVPENIVQNILAFFLIYILVFASSSLAMMLLKVEAHESLAAIGACISSYGPGYGKSGGFGNYHHFPALGKWILSTVMFLGRLEFVTVLIVFHPSFWKR